MGLERGTVAASRLWEGGPGQFRLIALFVPVDGSCSTSAVDKLIFNDRKFNLNSMRRFLQNMREKMSKFRPHSCSLAFRASVFRDEVIQSRG